MIRPLQEKDKEVLKSLECGFQWTYEQDWMLGLVFVDENDIPVMSVGAWSRAEAHMIVDPKWGTPGMRLAVLKGLHDHMERELKEKRVGVVVTWMDGMKSFVRRLKSLGWIKSDTPCFLRGVR